MDNFNISPEEKINNYIEFNPEFPVYKSNQYITGNRAILPTMNNIDVFSSIGKPTIAKTAPKKQAVNTNPEVKDEVDSLDYMKGIHTRADEVEKNNPAIKNYFTSGSYIGPYSNSLLKKQLAAAESDGLGGYKAFNNKGGGEGAVGKYQFRWTSWKDSIKKVTGVKSAKEFMDNPNAQEKFFDHYLDTTLKPQMETIKKEFPNSRMSDLDILKGLHFRGLGKSNATNGLRKILKEGLENVKIESFNSTLTDYLKVANRAK